MTDAHLQALLLKHSPHGVLVAAWIKAALREAHEDGYVQGVEMARKLLRLQLGLSVPSDREG